MTSLIASSHTLQARCGALEAAYEQIGRTRMAGVPVLNAKLQVQAVGFVVEADEAQVACGVLVTPWFMNLLRLPLDAQVAMLAVGAKAERDCGPQRFEFIGAFEDAVGAFEAASLYSPMFEFADQAAAVATAQEVLRLLRPLPEPAQPAQAARRGFLFGRSAVAAR